jgi:hypothetical protein
VSPGDEIVATAARHQPAGTQARLVADGKLIFQRRRQSDPDHIRLGQIDFVTDLLFLIAAEIAVTASHDLKAGIGLAQPARGLGIGFVG